MPVVPLRPRQAQPTLDNYLHGRDGGGDSDLVEPITEDSRSDLPLQNRPSSATNVASQPRHLTKHLSREERSAHDQVNGRSNGRPGLARAKSDFGPRRESQAENSEEEKSSASEGEFKIRHGWETQLTSEEYNNLLNSVCMKASCHQHLPRLTCRDADLLHVLHRQAPRDRRLPQV